MGDSWRFDPNKDYVNDEMDDENGNGRHFQKFGKKKNNGNSQKDFEKSFRKSSDKRNKNRR